MSLHSVLAVRCESDLLLHHLSGIGLAASRGTALLVDLDYSAPAYPGRMSIADLIKDGVRRSDLGPTKRGVSVLGHGGAEVERAVELVEVLSEGWPAVVIRAGLEPLPYPVVPVMPVFPADWAAVADRVVRQPVMRTRLAGGLELPPLRRSQVRSMLSGQVRSNWKWVRAWSPVWEYPWA